MKTVYELWNKTTDSGLYKQLGRHGSREAAASVSDIPDLNLWQVSGRPNDRHTPSGSWLITEEQEAENDADRITLALKLALSYGQIDGDHHKTWVIDQMVRTLAGDRYDNVITEYRDGEDGPYSYSWDEGTAP